MVGMRRDEWGTELKRIIVVDDDVVLRQLVCDYLISSGYAVRAAGNGAEFRGVMNEGHVDLVVLDLMLPGEDGLSLLQWMRSRQGPPVIIVSARGDEVDRVVGLELGADDYLAKPFGPRELLARVRAVLRRCASPGEDPETQVLGFGPFRLHLNNHALTRDGREITLTTGESNLLRVFLERPDRVLSRDYLVNALKGYERSPFDRSVDVRVTRLRRKIEQVPDAPVYLRTVWGEGYLFDPHPEPAE